MPALNALSTFINSSAAIRAALFWTFTTSIVLFPLGQAFRVAGPLVCLPFLLLLYRADWHNCSLRLLPPAIRWLFVCFFASLAFMTVWSIDHRASLDVIRPNLFRAFLVPFIAMECVRTEKDLKRLVLAFAATVFLQGLDGVWQFISGFDLIHKTPIIVTKGLYRLTGSMSTYRVGDYMGIMLLPAFALWFLLPIKNAGLRGLALLALLGPGLFLWLFAKSRMGYLAVAGGLYLVWVCIVGRATLMNVLLPVAALVLLLLFGPERVSLEHALNDERMTMWMTAFKTFLANPWFGTGAGTFVPAFQSAGFTVADVTPGGGGGFMHPHNLVLEIMVDGGITGTVGIGLFLLGTFFWGLVQTRQGVRLEQKNTVQGYYWHVTALFWGGWAGYLLINLAGGHGLYRGWFLTTGMSVLGIMLGACAQGPRLEEA